MFVQINAMAWFDPDILSILPCLRRLATHSKEPWAAYGYGEMHHEIVKGDKLSEDQRRRATFQAYVRGFVKGTDLVAYLEAAKTVRYPSVYVVTPDGVWSFYGMSDTIRKDLSENVPDVLEEIMTSGEQFADREAIQLQYGNITVKEYIDRMATLWPDHSGVLIKLFPYEEIEADWGGTIADCPAVDSATTRERQNHVFDIGKMLGRGTFGEVFVVSKDTTKVVKRIRKQGVDVYGRISEPDEYDAQRADVMHEVSILRRLKDRCDEYIVCLRDDGFKENAHYYYIVTEYLERYALLSQYNFRPDTFKEIAKNLVRGLRVIHSLGVAHLDIKRDNIMYSGVKIKYLDFGLSCSEALCANGWRAGTPVYQAPETWKKSLKGVDPFKADIWSLGVTLATIVLGHVLVDYWDGELDSFMAEYEYGKMPYVERDINERLEGTGINLATMLVRDPNARSLPQV